MNNQEEIKFTGVILDTRPDVLKDQDFKHEDKLVLTASAAATPKWEEKTPLLFKFYDRRNQSSSLSCMAQSGVKMLGIAIKKFAGKFLTLSAKPLYQSRTNTGGGMYQHECLAGLRKGINVLESQIPSQNMGESEINKPFQMTDEMKKSGEENKATKSYVLKKFNDIDTIASLLAEEKAVQLMLYFHGYEYWKNKPEVQDHSLLYWEERALRHGVTAVDFGIVDGEKCLVIEDSAGNESSISGNGQRIITEKFLNERCYASGYVEKNAFEIIMPTLRRGAKGDTVKNLQERLNSLIGTSLVTDGIFGINTENAVKKFQKEKGLVVDGVVGIKTCAELNK